MHSIHIEISFNHVQEHALNFFFATNLKFYANVTLKQNWLKPTYNF
jgi:hypothetical protein